MSLVMASLLPHDIVISADGRSTVTVNGEVTEVDDRFQKIFPIPDHPVVLAAMGENRLGGRPLTEFLGAFISRLNTGDFTMIEIADRLHAYAHPFVRERLAGLRLLKNGCGFWVAGFSVHEPGPRLVKIFWTWKETVLLTEELHYEPLSIVAGGDGKEQIDPVDWHAIDGKTVDEVCAHQRASIQKAIDAPLKVNSVGGRIHEVAIDSTEWRWTLPP